MKKREAFTCKHASGLFKVKQADTVFAEPKCVRKYMLHKNGLPRLGLVGT